MIFIFHRIIVITIFSRSWKFSQICNCKHYIHKLNNRLSFDQQKLWSSIRHKLWERWKH